MERTSARSAIASHSSSRCGERSMEREIALPQGSTIVLRPYRVDDVDALHEAVTTSIPELSPWMFWCHPGYSMQDSRTWVEARPAEWAQGTSYDFAILDPSSGALIGGCGLNAVNRINRFANLGYWVRTSATRR